MNEAAGAEHEPQGQGCDHNFTNWAYQEWAQSLFHLPSPPTPHIGRGEAGHTGHNGPDFPGAQGPHKEKAQPPVCTDERAVLFRM